MINNEMLSKYDTHHMCEIYDKWPKIARDAYEKKIKPLSLDGINHVIFVGISKSTVSDIQIKYFTLLFLCFMCALHE